MSAKIERIALMAGKTTYKDFRQGFSTVSLAKDTDLDIKAALGIAKHQAGALALAALETHAASTLMHEKLLVRAWDAHTRATHTKRTPHDKAILRFAISITIRQHAGRKLMSQEIVELAYLLCIRRETLENILKLATAWLQDLTGTGEKAFLEAMAVLRPKRQLRRTQDVRRVIPQVA